MAASRPHAFFSRCANVTKTSLEACGALAYSSVVEVATVLRALANERRLMILCKLVEWGEANVSSLAAGAGLSRSAASQHLAKMREEGIVATRRESQIVWYRIADTPIEHLFATLHGLFCRPADERTQVLSPSPLSTSRRLRA